MPISPLLDQRLATALALVPPCRLCADIGADHGKLSAALLLQNRAQRVLVSDISEKALGKARKLLAQWRLSSKAAFVVADGLDALAALGADRPEVVCVLGMGGDTMAGILRRGAARLSGATLVLGAQTELPLLRQALCEAGYRLRQERVAEAAGRFYLLLQAAPAEVGEPLYTERELFLGPCLLRDRPEGWDRMLRHKLGLHVTVERAVAEAGNHKDDERLLQIRREMAYLREALAQYGQ